MRRRGSAAHDDVRRLPRRPVRAERARTRGSSPASRSGRCPSVARDSCPRATGARRARRRTRRVPRRGRSRPRRRRDREQPLLLPVQQLVAPLDSGAQRPLPLRRIARTAGQERERQLEPLQELLRAEQADPRRRELERERETVETAADRGDRRRGLEAGSTARARSTKSVTASPSASGLDGVLAARRATRSGSRLVASTFTPVVPDSRSVTIGAASRICSRLSRSSRMLFPARNSAGSFGARPPARSSARRAPGPRRPEAGSRRRRRELLGRLAASWSASRVFPEPPGPRRVRARRLSREQAPASSSSRFRPRAASAGPAGSSGAVS